MMRRAITQALCLILLTMLPAFAEAYDCEPRLLRLSLLDKGDVVGVSVLPRFHIDANGLGAYWGCRAADGTVTGAEFHATMAWLTTGGRLTEWSVNYASDPEAWKAKNLKGIACFGTATSSDPQERDLCAALVSKFKGTGWK
jgi:hypothetical protein